MIVVAVDHGDVDGAGASRVAALSPPKPPPTITTGVGWACRRLYYVRRRRCTGHLYAQSNVCSLVPWGGAGEGDGEQRLADGSKLVVRGAREHNLRNVSLDLPRDRLIVFTGLSGSGKSSLAFDTIYAEGQRRYVESLSSYARQFLGQMDKPDVDFIEGLSPAISIDQKSASRNPRSTVGTITEIYDYLRLLYARVGVPHCPRDGTVVQRQTPQQIVDRILELPDGTRFQVLAPVVRGRKGEYQSLLEELAGQGFARARIDGEVTSCRTRPSWPATRSTPSRWSSTAWSSGTGSSGG